MGETESNKESKVCIYHPMKEAVTVCAKCGKWICEDCASAGLIRGGELKGRSLCFSCAEELVQKKLQKLSSGKDTKRKYWIRLAIGAVVGIAVGCLLAGNFPGSAIDTGIGGVLFRILWAITGVALLGAPREFMGNYWKMYMILKSLKYDGLLVRILKSIVKAVVSLLYSIFKTVWDVVAKLFEGKKKEKYISDKIERNLKIKKCIMEYRTSCQDGNPSVEAETLHMQKQRELSEMLTVAVCEPE